jgi:hypothetical protein
MLFKEKFFGYCHHSHGCKDENQPFEKQIVHEFVDARCQADILTVQLGRSIVWDEVVRNYNRDSLNEL